MSATSATKSLRLFQGVVLHYYRTPRDLTGGDYPPPPFCPSVQTVEKKLERGDYIHLRLLWWQVLSRRFYSFQENYLHCEWQQWILPWTNLSFSPHFHTPAMCFWKPSFGVFLYPPPFRMNKASIGQSVGFISTSFIPRKRPDCGLDCYSFQSFTFHILRSWMGDIYFTLIDFM